jgi:hypothetical protein
MGAARHRHTEVAIRLREKGIDDIEHATGEVLGLLAEVHPEQGRDLVIAGAARAQTSADMGAGALDQAPLQGGVHVLVVLGGSEGAGDDICFELVQAGQHRRECVVVEEASGREDLRVGTAARDVVARQAPVEVGRLRQCCKGIRRSAGEPAAPQAELLPRRRLEPCASSALSFWVTDFPSRTGRAGARRPPRWRPPPR